MHDVVFIGHHRDVAQYHEAGIPAYAPPIGLLAERVLAERGRYRVMAMTEETFRDLPTDLARELRESPMPHLEIVPGGNAEISPAEVVNQLRRKFGNIDVILA